MKDDMRDGGLDILNALPHGVLALDGAGLIFQVNRPAAILLGRPAEDIVGQDIGRLWPRSAEEILRIAAGRRHTAGMTPPELEDCFVQITPLPQSRGAVLAIFDLRLWRPFFSPGQAVDPLTPYYKEIFERSADGICIADGHGRMLLVNQASGLNVGIPHQEMRGRHVDYLTDNKLVSDTVTMEVIRTRRPVTRIIRHFRTDKRILLTGQPIFGPDGQVRLVVTNERDLTMLLELETSLKREKRIAARFRDELESLRLAELAENEIVAQSPSMARIVGAALKLARYGARQILITGESGVGKGLLAKFIHAHSRNASEPFIHINCAALPESLLEAELFGYEPGAFTGAAPEGRAGLFEAAGGGTAFLDEIGDLPPHLQAKLLTFLDNREFRRLTGRRTLTASCAVIAATNRDLEKLAAGKQFRQDLYFRLSLFCLHIPPLRERKEDLMELARREVDKLNARHDSRRELDPLALESLQAHPFPGNVRELVNRLQQAALLSDGPELGPFLRRVLGSAPGQAARPAPAETGRPETGAPLAENLALAERAGLVAALKECASTREMARRLGISQASVSRKLKKYALRPPRGRPGRPRGGRSEDSL